MKRFGRTPAPAPLDDGRSSSTWTSQLIGFEIDSGAVVLDFVALEPRPGREADWPRGTPFTIHIEVADVAMGTVESVLRAWADSADVVAITLGKGAAGRASLSLAAEATKLITHVVGPQARRPHP